MTEPTERLKSKVTDLGAVAQGDRGRAVRRGRRAREYERILGDYARTGQAQGLPARKSAPGHGQADLRPRDPALRVDRLVPKVLEEILIGPGHPPGRMPVVEDVHYDEGAPLSSRPWSKPGRSSSCRPIIRSTVHKRTVTGHRGRRRQDHRGPAAKRPPSTSRSRDRPAADGDYVVDRAPGHGRPDEAPDARREGRRPRRPPRATTRPSTPTSPG